MSAGTLRDFFNVQSKTGLTPDRKAQIFANIQGQIKPATRQTTSFSHMRSSWYFKTATTAALAFTLIYILYTPISGPLFQTKDNVLIARQGNIAQAWYVGNILATQGEINVVRNGVSTKTNQLKWWDIVYLYNTSKADFTLRDGSRGVVEWPAQLTIVEHADSGLILSVDHARYMQIDKAHTGLSTNTGEKLVIETPKSRITTDKDDVVHLALVTTQERQFVQNKWDSVTIESIVPATASPVSQQLASSTVADVTDSVKVYNQVAIIYDELKTQSTSQTYDLTSGELAADDIKSLLTLQDHTRTESKSYNNTESHHHNTQLVYQPSDAQMMVSQPEGEVIDDASEPDITPPATLMAVMNSDETTDIDASKMRASPVAVAEPTQVNHQDSKLVNTLLASDTWEVHKEPTMEVTIPPSDKALSEYQLILVSNLGNKTCITKDHVEKLQSWFDISSWSSLEELMVAITSHYYLTADLKSIITSISICKNDKD
jgi:hypothetical protein